MLNSEAFPRNGELNQKCQSSLLAFVRFVAMAIVITFLGLSTLTELGTSHLLAQEKAETVRVWEFSPYEVQLWYAFDANVSLSEVARTEFLRRLESELERTFKAAWNTRISPLPEQLSYPLMRDFDGFSLESLTAGELVLVVSNSSERTRTIRTFDAALESLEKIQCEAAIQAQLAATVARLNLPENSSAVKLLQRCQPIEPQLATVGEQLSAGEIDAALIPRAQLSSVAEHARPLITTLPWQTQTLLKEYDKLFLLTVAMRGNDFHIQARELDCPMQSLGPAMSGATAEWQLSARVAASVLTSAFAPVARVEDADRTTASLRLRAGGLVLETDLNPAAIRVGDVVQPIVRRNDRNGVPTLLSQIPWTYAAVTETDGINLQANVYTYSGGPGLEGQRNRRTERVVLRVRQPKKQTHVRLVVRGTDTPLSGSFVYRKDFLTDNFELIGRTDWRGQLTISSPDEPVALLPDAIRSERLIAKNKAAQEAKVKGAVLDFSPINQNDPQLIQLNAELLQLYVKNGDSILAKLPIVPGIESVQTAELPDDSRRLNAEAFIRGFQGEILDLIGLRSLLAARIQLHLKNGKLELAEQTLDELRRLRNYNEMTDRLESIQRRMLDEQSGAIPLRAKASIDRMFQSTRDMLQKYMQDSLMDDSQLAVAKAKQAS